MKVLVTGATGFIGNYVVNELLERNVEVVASSLQSTKAISKDWYKSVNYIPFDLAGVNETINYYSFFGRPEKMIHLAWEGLPDYKAEFHEKINLPRHYTFLENMVKHGLKDLTVTGTCLEYGMKEGLLEETMKAEPGNAYGRAKNELRIKLENLQKQFDFSLKWLRLFYMYGKGQNPKSLLSQLDKAIESGEESFDMSGGEQVRDYLPVEKLAGNIAEIALQNKVTGVINNCSGVPVSVKDFVVQYLKNTNRRIKLNLGAYSYPDYEPMRFWGDTTKFKKAINHE